MNTNYPSPETDKGMWRKIAYLTLGIFLSITAIPAYGQDAENAEEEDEEVFELSPFVVDSSDDDRYLSNNSTSATGLRMQLRDLPVPVTVLNREYLDDLQSDDMDSALRYTAGVFTRSYQTSSTSVASFNETSSSTIGDINDPFQNVISIRGFDVPNQQRSGFRVGSSVPTWGVVLGGGTDDITRERLEVVRGPQALLYGINVLSGVVNIIPKRPLPQFGGSFSVSAGSYDLFRTAVDLTGPVIKDNVLNYRVMGSYQESGDQYEVDFRESERQNFAIQFDWNPSHWANFLFEMVDSEGETRGIGPQYFQDDNGSENGFKTNFAWKNEWGELFRFGRDDPSAPSVDPNGTVWYDPIVYNPLNSQYYPEEGFQDFGNTFNVSGPDTYRNQKERTYLALLALRPNSQLNIELGWYRVETEVDTFNVSLYGMTDSAYAGVPKAYIGAAGRGKRNLWLDNPEVMAADALNDPIGYGITEAFSFPQETFANYIAGGLRSGFPDYVEGYPNNPEPARNTLEEGVDRKFAAYNFYRVPTTVDTDQLRARIVYKVESDFLNIPADHTFIGGYHYIEDRVEYVQGGAGNFNYIYTRENDKADSPFKDYVANDPIIFRDSILDFEPIRYNGESVYYGGRRNIVTNGRDRDTPVSDLSIARSGYSKGTLWYRGVYGIYTGQFWKDRVTVVAGMREDTYQVKEREQLVIVSQAGADRLTDNWMGYGPATYLNDQGKPYFIGYGNKPYEYIDDLPAELNAKVERDILAFQSDEPNGTVRLNFEEAQKFLTKTGGITFRINDNFATYFLYSEGVFPNTGRRDGNDDPIDAELTENLELGLKYDLWDGKISGSVSVYRIRRDNATYSFSDAPTPKNWAGGINNPGTTWNTNRFSPGNADSTAYQDWAALGNQFKPRTYQLSIAYLEAAFEEAGVPLPIEFDEERGIYNPRSESFEDYGAFYFTGYPHPYADGLSDYYWWFNYEQIREGPERHMLDPNDPANAGIDPVFTTPIPDENRALIRRAFELAMTKAPTRDANPESPTFGQMVDYGGSGVAWDAFNDAEMNNASIYGGATTVTFSDETLGVDGQVIFSPTKNYQLIFEFSHQEREIVGRGFNFVDPIAMDTGINWGTEYDKWVWLLGAENFEDVTRPSTFNGEGINGIDLSGVPATNLTLWNRFDFKDGPLQGVAMGGGVNWHSAVQTSVEIGNVVFRSTGSAGTIAPNLYPTPDLPDRYELEAFISYRWQDWLGADWSLQLNVRNLLDDDYEIVSANYTNPQGGPENRRIEAWYPGRSFRVSLSAKF